MSATSAQEAFERSIVPFDMSRVWGSLAQQADDVDDEVVVDVGPRRRTEKVVKTVEVEQRVGNRTWMTTASYVVIRTAKPGT